MSYRSNSHYAASLVECSCGYRFERVDQVGDPVIGLLSDWEERAIVAVALLKKDGHWKCIKCSADLPDITSSRVIRAGELIELLQDTVSFIEIPPMMTRDAGSLSPQQLLIACKNIGFDLSCGACAELFYTGTCLHEHDPSCSTSDRKSRKPISAELEISIILIYKADGSINEGLEEVDGWKESWSPADSRSERVLRLRRSLGTLDGGYLLFRHADGRWAVSRPSRDSEPDSVGRIAMEVLPTPSPPVQA